MTAAADTPPTRRVRFLRTHNSARCQMAEGLLPHPGGDRFAAFSAATEATRVRPLAIRAMADLGITAEGEAKRDISGHKSGTLDRYLDQSFGALITICDQANEACPDFFGAKEQRHGSVPDPRRATGTEAEQLDVYRRVRDASRGRIERERLLRR